MAKTTQERYSRKKTTKNTASQTSTERNSHYKSETKKQQEAKNTKVNVTDRNSHYNSETYKENKPKVETKVEPKVETKVEPKVETKVEPKKEKKQSKTSTERNSHYDSSKIYDKINETVKKEPVQLDQETFNTWMDTATGRQGTQREKQEAYNNEFINRLGKGAQSIVTDLAGNVVQAYDIGKEAFIKGDLGDLIKQYLPSESLDTVANVVDLYSHIANKVDPNLKDFSAVDENNLSYKLNKKAEDLAYETTEGTTGLENFALNTLMGAGNMVAHLGLAYATGGAINPVLTMAGQSGIDKTYQNLQEGYDMETSVGNGLMTGVVTSISEKFGMDRLAKVATSGLGKFALSGYITECLSEGLEEGAEYTAEYLLDKFTLGKDEDYSFGELFMSVVYGISVSGLMTAGAEVKFQVSTRKQFNQLKADVKTLTEYKNTNQLTEEESIAVNSALQLANEALNKFESTSVLKNAVQYESDKVKDLSAREVMENFNKFLQPQIDQETMLNQEQQAVNSILENSQKVLAQKGIQMDAMQYASLKEDVRKQVDKVQGWANDLGVKIAFSTSVDKDGVYDPNTGTTIVNPDSELAPLTAFTHEITHGVEASRFYPILDSLIVGNKDITNQLEKIKTRYAEAGVTLDDDGARREYIAIQTQGLLGNEDFVKRLVRYNNSLAYRIYEGIKHIVSKTDTLQEIEYNFLKAFREYGIDAEQQAQPQYSVVTTPSGKDVIVLDKLNTNPDGTVMSDLELYKTMVGNRYTLNDGSVVEIVNRLPGKQLYLELFKRFPRFEDGSYDYKKINSLLNQNYEEIMKNSNFKQNLPDFNNKHSKQNIVSFDTREVNVFDGKKARNFQFDIATLADGRKVAYAKKFLSKEDALLTQELKKMAKSNSSLLPSSNNKLSKKLKKVKHSIGLTQDSLGRSLSKEQQEFFKESALRDENGNLKPFYHGTPRADRVGYYFDPNKATSGPMAYFTDNKEIANNYARDKKDTSIAYDERYDSPETQFRVERNGKDIPVGELWKSMSYKERMDFKKKAQQLTKDWDNEDEVVLYFDEGNKYGIGNLSDYEIREKNGNVINALVHSWVTEGNLWGEEHQFLEVLKAMGIDDAYYLDPEYRDEKTYEVYLNVKNPFNTSVVDETFVESLEDFINETDMSKYNKESQHADMWDKNSVDMSDWIYKLNDDIANGTAHVWTSIPDVVTDFLKSNGYDGILDVGGKRGGDLHQVAIPFYSNQIKETSNEKPTANKDIRYSIGLTPDDLNEIDDLLDIDFDDWQTTPKYKSEENYHPQNKRYKQYNELVNRLNELDQINDMESLEAYVDKYYYQNNKPIRDANLEEMLENGFDEDLLDEFKWNEEYEFKIELEDYKRAGKNLQERYDGLNQRLYFDNNGRWLTPEQREYFKNTNIFARDKNGNLKTFYHGTSDGGHTVFELQGSKNGRVLGDGFYFSDSKRLAEEYTIDYKTKTAKNPQLYEVYLKMENTLSNETYDGELVEKAYEIYKKYDNSDGEKNSPHYKYVQGKLETASGVIDYFKHLSEKNNIPFGDLMKEYGYDSINSFNEFVVFDSEQIKNVTNTKPTSSKDIRYSIGLTPQELNESRKYEREKASLLKDLQGFGVTKVDSNYETLYNEAISNVLKTGEVSPELYEEIKKETWERMVDIQENPLNENAKQIREFIRNNPISIQSFNKGDFAGKKEWNEWRKKNFGIFRFSKDKGASIDTIYDEFNNMFSGLVDTSITSSYDQLMELKRVVDLVGEEGTEVHISEYGMDKETFNTFFDEKMNDFIDDIKTHENLKKFEDSIKLDTNVDVSDVEMEHLLDGKLTDTEYEKFLKLQDKMVDGASTWIPNYSIIRNKYTEFSEKNFAKALFENLVYGNVSDETRQALKNDVLYKFFGGDEASYNENPVAKNRLNEFLNDSIKNFIADAQYKSNKQYMRSIATKVNNLLRGYTDGVDNVQFNNKYEQQEALKRITDMIKANRKERMGSLKEIVSALPIEGQDKVNRLRTLEQNLDLIAGGKGELRTMLREALEMPRYNAQTEYAKTLDKYNDVIADIIKNDLIREGTKESKAVQWIMETHKENGEEYDSYKLREDFNYTMANGKKAYENIESASRKLRTAYDEIFNTINTQRYSIYGDVELENSIETKKLEAKVRQQERLIEDYEQMLAKSPTAQLQSAYDSALIELKKLQNQLDVKKQSDASGDSIRRQKLLYRKNFAHHIIKRKGVLGTIVEGVRNIPTRLSGISDYAKPRTAYAGFFNKQAENNHNYEADAIAGFASYIKDASKVIAYDPLIDYYRTFNSDLRAMAKDTEMSRFVSYLDAYANNLAGKTEDFDRAVRNNVNKSISVIKKLNERVKSNALLFNFRTAFTQVYNIPNGVGVLSKNGGVETSKDFIKGALDYFTTFTSDSTVREQSPFLKARFFDTDTGKQGIGATMDDIQNFMLTKGDEISTKLIWNVAYQQGLRKGVEDPIFYADDLTRRSVGGRSVGEVPLLLQSEIVNLFAPFQIETTNAFINTLDMVKDKKALPALLAMLIANWLFNEMSDELFKDRILFDPIDVIGEAIENEESLTDTAFRMGGEILANTPFGQFAPQFLFGWDDNEKEKIFGESDPSRYGVGNMGLSVIGNAIADVKDGNYLDAISDVIANYGLPRGGKQLQRTIEALQTNGMLPQFENGQLVQEPIYYTGSGKVGYVTNPDAIMDSPENFFDFAKQVMFGKWAGKEAQEYINGGFKSMGKTQTNMFESLNESMNTSDSYNMAEEVYEAKKNMTGEDGKRQFIEYLNSGEFTPEQRNEIYDTYYGDSAVTVRINDFAKATKLDADQTFKVKDILSTTVSLKDSSGESVRNSKALSIRKQLDELGLYDDVVKYINDNGLDYGDMGLNKTVGAMSNSEFQSKYKEIYGESYKAQTDDTLYNAYASTFSNKTSGSKKGSTSSKNTSNKTTSSKKESASSNKTSSKKENASNKETASTSNNVFSFDEHKAKIDSILAKVYGGTSSTTSAYNKIENILNKVKSSKTKSTIDVKSKYSKLIKDYLKNHPEDAHLFS